MTPEERQLLSGLADRLKMAPAQQKDPEAEQLIRALVAAQPDTPYLLAQTTLMQDFALRAAQAQINDLQRQLAEAKAAGSAASTPGGSFLGSLFGGRSSVPVAGSAPRPNPWAPPAPTPAYAQPTYAQPAYAAPVLQPSQTSGFLQNAAQTAVGIAGGMLLFQGIESLFSGHQGGWGGGYGGGPWGGGSGGPMGPTETLTETTIINNNYYDGVAPEAFGDHGTDLANDVGGDLGGDFGGDFGGDDQSI